MRRILLFAVVLCASMCPAFAQTVGEITGEVKDQSGANAPNASVTATNTETNVARSTVTNSAGVYSFPGLTFDQGSGRQGVGWRTGRGTSSCSPVSSSSTSRQPQSSASSPCPSSGPEAMSWSPAASARGPAVGRCNGPLAAPRGCGSRVRRRAAGRRGWRLRRATRARPARARRPRRTRRARPQDRVQLLLLLDEPHHLLGLITEVLGCLREVDRPRNGDGSRLSAAARSTQSSSRSFISSRRSSRWRTSAARPWSRSTSAE